jgi:hypothetical protein
MTPAVFRRIALKLEGVSEGAHMGHADFRVEDKVFATLGWPDRNFGMVKLPREIQEAVVRAHPESFEVVDGAWGQRGATKVRLANVGEAVLADVIASAWQRIVSKPTAAKSRGKTR